MRGFKKGNKPTTARYANGGEVKQPGEQPQQDKQKPEGQAPEQQPEGLDRLKDYGKGGALNRRMEALGLKDGGMVHGPGTGTSDDVKTEVPEGSYIMPADSTKKIGEQALSSMGKDVPVNLSNGEYQLPPEQVHAIGVQALDAMKGATHTPVAKQQAAKGFRPAGQEAPEMFFADGGLIDQFSQNVGGYWSKDNAQFEASNPSTLQRVGRAINPLTGFGSAIGSMYDAAGNGDLTGVGLAAAQSIPAFAATRAAGPAIKAVAAQVPSATKTAAAVAGNTGFSVAADHYQPEAQNFADGGGVFSKVDPDEIGHSNTPQRKVIPRQTHFYVDGAGTTTNVLPSQSRALVPAGPVTGSSLVPAQQPLGPVPRPEAPKADFYSNSRGETGRGFAPSSSQGMTPAGPVTSHTTSTSMVPSGPVTDHAPKPAPKTVEFDARARAMSQANIAKDSADYLAHRAAQNASFEAAKVAPPKGTAGLWSNMPQKLGGIGGTTAVLSAIPEGVDVYRVAADPNSSTLDVATQAAEGVGRWGASTVGGAAGAKAGAALGAFGGPLAPLTVPAGALIGGVGGGLLGYYAADSAIDAGREALGSDPTSPVDRIPKPAPAPQEMVTRRDLPVQAPAAPSPAPAAPSPAPAAQPKGNGFKNTTVQGVVGKQDDSGQYSFTNDPAAVAGASGTLPMPKQAGSFNVLETQRPAVTAESLNASLPSIPARGFSMPATRSNGALADAAGRAALAAASRPYQGSQNGQLTASQLRTLAGLQDSAERQDISRETNAANLATEQMRQEGADYRAAYGEQGQNGRFAATYDLESQRTAADLEDKGFSIKAGRRLEKLYNQYDKAKPEERAAIAEQIRVLSGKEAPNRFTVVPGGQGFSPDGMPYTLPSMVINNQTGQRVDMSAGAQAPSIDQDPRAIAIKNDQSLSRDERVKKLRELGYQ